MMNDKKFREDCKVLANDIIDSHCGWKQSLTVPTNWVDIMEDTSQLDTAALLYIAANMPSVDDEKKKPCRFCKDIKSKEARVRITCKGTNGINDTDSEITIKYCPLCSRKL